MTRTPASPQTAMEHTLGRLLAGLEHLGLVDRNQEVCLRAPTDRFGPFCGQGLFDWDHDTMRIDEGGAIAEDIAIGALLLHAGCEPVRGMDPTTGWPHLFVTASRVTGHERLSALAWTRLLLERCGWTPGMALADLGVALATIHPQCAWRQSDYRAHLPPAQGTPDGHHPHP